MHHHVSRDFKVATNPFENKRRSTGLSKIIQEIANPVDKILSYD